MNLIKDFRKEKGITQKEFAEKTGVSINKISMVENNKGIDIEGACGICNAFPKELEIKQLAIQRREE